jgi:histidinol phosphatase-like PHP family hydrolase
MSLVGTDPAELPSNAAVSEWCCLTAEQTDVTEQQRRALRRAGRAALGWSIEARDLLAQGRPLTELRWIGPWLARLIERWLTVPPGITSPPPPRQHFLTRTEVDAVLAGAGAGAAVRGDLQTHTLGSDGTASIEDMVAAARARGLEYLAITDHSKGLAIAGGMDEVQLAGQGEHIQRLNAELHGSGFTVLRAVELNLSPDGAGDLDARFLDQLDLVLGAFHSRLRVATDQTDRYLAALRNRTVDVLAHPRGRIFNFRLGLTADWGRVFECARACDCAVEIDGFPDRQDLDLERLRLARETGVRISIGSDAHAPHQIAFVDYGLAAARLAGIPDDRILNCMSAEALRAWASQRRA